MNYRKAGDILSALFKDSFDPQILEQAKTFADLFSSWAAVTAEAGIPAASVHSRIAGNEKGIVLVETDHPGWIQVLQTQEGRLLTILQRRFGGNAVQGISCRLSREPFPAEEAEAAPEETGPEPPPPDAAPVPASLDETYLAAKKAFERSLLKRNGLLK